MRDHLLMGGIGLLALGRALLAWGRLKLYRRHEGEFSRTDAPSVGDGWRRTLARGGVWVASWWASLAFCVAIPAVVLYHPATPRPLRDALAGAFFYWLLGRLCVEGYYLVNRYLVLSRPAQAARIGRRFPRSGLAVEAMLTGFVWAPTAAAAAAEPAPFVVAGAAALTIQALVASGRLASARAASGETPDGQTR